MGNLCLALFISVLNIFKSLYIGAVNDQEKQHIVGTFKYLVCVRFSLDKM